MIAGSVLGSIFGLGKKIYLKVGLVKANKLQCQRLAHRIALIESAIKGLEKIPQSQNFEQGLQHLEQCLQESLDFINQFIQQNKWYQKALKANDNELRFQNLNQQLRDCAALLKLGLSAQQLQNHEQDLADQKADMAVLKAGQEEIFKMQREVLKEFKGAAQQRDKLLARQLASLKFHLQNIDRAKESKSLLVLKDQIAYCELIFCELIGEGSISQVYKGRWQEQEVAIKLLSAPLSQAEGKEFSREVAIISRLRNSYIVPFYGACLEEKNACLVMEWAPKGSLYQCLGKKQFNPLQCKQIALDIARGLQYLHNHHQMIHGDLRSQNVLLTNEFRAKLADFGLVRTSGYSIQSIGKISQGLAWCAPEILASEEMTLKADIYSFGMILWELCMDKRPFFRLSSAELIKHIAAGQREELSDEIPVEVKSLIMACWSAKPEERPDASSLITQLEQYNPVKSYYQRGKILEDAKRFQEAAQCYETAANNGMANALTSLGIFYLRGLGGISLDKSKAYQYFINAAEQGHPRGMKNAAIMLDKGDGILQDQQKALFWYQKAGDKDSMSRATRLQEKFSQPPF